MKNIIKIALAFVTALAMLLCSCADNTVTEPDVTTQGGGDTAPEVSEAKHEITISDVESILAENGLSTNINKWTTAACAYHGGQQMRVCHTERGTYTAFVRDFGPESTDGLQKFYVAKTDEAGKSTLIYYGEFESDDSTITVNIGQDSNGDVWVVTSSRNSHNAIVFDRDTDEFTEHRESTDFASGETLGYSQTMFDFENRKIYAFHNGVFGSGKYLLEWYTFDIESGTWSDTSIYKWIDDTYRHVYLYPFADGKGGAYIVGMRGDSKFESEGKPEAVRFGYAWDQLDLFYIPDLTSPDDIVFTTIQPVYDERGDEGIWSYIYTQAMDVYVDNSGYMHISYLYQIYDAAGLPPDFYSGKQYHHAVYNGMECIFNEELDFIDTGYATTSRAMVRQSTDGRLHMIVAKLDGEVIELDFYSAEDELGQSWKHENKILLDEGVTTPSLTVSALRDGSVQDNVLSCFFYGYYDINSTGYTFNINLEDYSVTELINILEGFDIQLGWRYDERMPYADHQTQIIRTDGASYAAFVYNFNGEEKAEYFHIAKIDAGGKATILYSGSYPSSQDKFLSMTAADGGKIYVCPPSGSSVWVIDTNTDEVTTEKRTETVISSNVYPQQSDMVFDAEGNGYYLYTLPTEAFGIAKLSADNEKSAVVLKKSDEYTFDRELDGSYTEMYTLPTENGGVYMVGAREVFLPDLDGELEYMGNTKTVNDSLMLFYIPDIAEGNEVKCAEIIAPYTEQGGDGIWSVADVKDAYIDSNGKLNVLYSYYHFDFDDADRRENPELIEKTLKFFIAVYDGAELVSSEEIKADGFTYDTSIRFAETADGEVYLITCNLINEFSMDYGRYSEGEEAKIDIYFKDEGGWVIAASKALGDFAADGLFISSSLNSVDCLIYASNGDVYYVNINFEPKN